MKLQVINTVLIAGMFYALGIGTSLAGEILWDSGEIDVKAPGELYKKPGYSPYAGRNFPTMVYWGDTHVHTG